MNKELKEREELISRLNASLFLLANIGVRYGLLSRKDLKKSYKDINKGL